MKIMTILGTRPELIRLCLIIKKLDQLCDLVLVHTGQNYDANLNDIFIDQLGIRKMDYYLGAHGTFGEQIGTILTELEKVLIKEKPDRFLVLGDTNSSMGAIMAKRLGIPVYHMEAGNRCNDDRVPEEVNRRIIDHSSDILMPYSKNSRDNLLAENIPPKNIFVTGNPIKEVLDYFAPQIDTSTAFSKFNITAGNYFLATLHRAENVDIPERLGMFVSALNQTANKYNFPIVWSIHPRTKKQLSKIKGLKLDKNIYTTEPLGLFDFVHLEKNAKCVLSDSGTVQEECSIFKVPSISMRDTTERPETIEVGSNMLSGAEPESIMTCLETVLSAPPSWEAPPEYLVSNVSETIAKIILGYRYAPK